MILLLVSLIITFFVDGSDKQSSTIDKLVNEGKKEIFGTARPTLFDTNLKKQYENLARTNPEAYQKLVAYEERKLSKNSSSGQKSKN